MTELSNTALIRAIHAHTPPDSTPASVLMDVLNIGREAAYRRMRGEVRFTFGEASALSAHLRFSLDVIEAQTGQRPAEIALISSEYHLYRATWFARQEGVTAYGVPAHTGNFGILLNFSLREIAAVWYYCVLGG